MMTTMSLTLILSLYSVLHLCCVVSSAVVDDAKYKGENYTIKCPEAQEDSFGVYLLTRRKAGREVLFFQFSKKTLTVHDDFKNRVQIKPDGKTLTIDILNLQLEDTGVYWCTCASFEQDTCRMPENGDYLVIKNPVAETAQSTAKTNTMNDFLIPVTALTAGSVLLLLLLVGVVWIAPKIKARIRQQRKEEKGPGNGVYEVMTIPRQTGKEQDHHMKI